MSKLLFSLGFVGVLTVISSVMLNVLPRVSEVDIVLEKQTGVSEESADFEWKKVLEDVPLYFKKPVDNKQPEPQKEKKKPVRVRKPTEAKFVGVVNSDSGSKSVGIFLLPKKSQPQTLKVGEGWLRPWTIKEVKADYVIWLNADTNDEIKQTLF